jgi:hypothetical protein
MFSTLRTRFGIPGVISVIALVFAMFGGAYAATNSSGGGKATASAKAKKGPRGPKGATGPAGPVGPAGQAGPAGPAGPAGSPGKEGPSGKEGTAGKEGKQGKEGSPWTAGGTLPSGKTETGTWGFDETAKDGHATSVAAPISFPIPLSASIEEANVHIFEGETPPSGCALTARFLEASAGNLCVQIDHIGFEESVKAAELRAFNLETLEPNSSGRTGLVLAAPFLPEGLSGVGTWAVTAP